MNKITLPVDFKALKEKFGILSYLERISVGQILLFWGFVLVLFGIVYFALSYYGQGVVSSQTGLQVSGWSGLLDSIYFSFITATSTGYGDFLPTGLSKPIALFEVIAGLTIFGMLISKLVSVKQEVILQEVYDISFDERINRLRSALYLFRSDVNKIIERIVTRQIKQKEMKDLWITFSSFESTLTDIRKMTHTRKVRGEYIKEIDAFTLQLILNSIDLSLRKTVELLERLNRRGYSWKNELTLHSIDSIDAYSKEICTFYSKRKIAQGCDEKFARIEEVLKELNYQAYNYDGPVIDKDSELKKWVG